MVNIMFEKEAMIENTLIANDNSSSTTNTNNSTFSMNYNFITSNATSSTSASSSTASQSPKDQDPQQVHILPTLNPTRQHFDSYRQSTTTPGQLSDASLINTSNPQAAYLVQTIDGNTLLIPHSASMSNGIFLANSQNTINRNMTVPIEMVLQQQQNLLNNLISSKSFDRPESNVYQTIENDRCLYTDGFYDTSTFRNTFKNSKKYKHFNVQNVHELQQQQQALLHNQDVLKQLSSTINTNSNNLMIYPHNSSSKKPKNIGFFSKRLNDKLKTHCSWKLIAILFLILVFSLFTLIIYLSVMRTYNLDWTLKTKSTQNVDNLNAVQVLSTVQHQDRKIENSVYFSKIGDLIEDLIDPNEFFNIQFYLDRAVYVKFNVSINGKNSHLGIYGDKNNLPSYTKFRFFETFNSDSMTDLKKDVKKKNGVQTKGFYVNSGFVYYLDEGLWYISMLNDNNRDKMRFQLKTEFYENINLDCKEKCSGKGECVDGHCQCFPGYSGDDCSQNVCPIVCNGNGQITNGQCICARGWHGSECSIQQGQCEVPDCYGHGECVDGNCVCKAGFTGHACEQTTCLNPNCSGNGICLDNKCKCFDSFTGDECETRTQANDQICSNNGYFDYASRTCTCKNGWTGLTCANSNNCMDRLCTTCKPGWEDVNCQTESVLQCTSKCALHGVCIDGVCNCSRGYYGRNCQINGCPNNCNANGICEKIANQYQCACKHGWTGIACDSATELICNDNIDNDKDGLIDCMDSECCSSEYCKLSASCNASPEPKDRLLRKQPPSIQATFFDKMKFLIEDGSVQQFADVNTFSESQVSVIRGQVLFKNGQPLIGVKVSASSSPQYGYTLTRNNGIFDLMVNGGGSVTLQFSRNRLKTKYMSVNVIWNQFAYIDNVTMYLHDDDDADDASNPSKLTCSNHDGAVLLKPVVKTTWTEMRTYYYDSSVLLPDQGAVRSEIKITDTNLNLVYTSSQANGFNSIIYILMTSKRIPVDLDRIHLKIVVEGILNKYTFDAHPNLHYEYAWDRRNAYEQRVYGFTYAKVSIGYQYENCDFIDWHEKVVKLNGYDLATSEIGGWNIDVQHRLNFQQGILHKGCGTTINLNEIKKTVAIAGGQLNRKRDVHCQTCDHAMNVAFYEPYSLSINKDGLIFVADYNYIWMFNNSEHAQRVVELRTDQPYRYSLANDPINGYLYIADPIKRQIFNTKAYENIIDPINNFNLEYGTGLYCDNTLDCGDDSIARNMKMAYPKDFDFDSNGVMYFIDGNRIRKIDADGRVHTIINQQPDNLNVFKPQVCNRTYAIDTIKLFWPTSLTVNPLDNSIYFLDNSVIYRIANEKTVVVVAGIPDGCNVYPNDQVMGVFTRLLSPVDMDFNVDGDLYILENDRKSLKQIRVLKANGEIDLLFSSDEQDRGSLDFELVNTTSFNDPIAIGVHPNRSVFVLDKGDNVLYHLKNSLIKNENNGRFSVMSPEKNESYTFNRFGLHLNTIDLLTGNILYNFIYNGNALYGKLVSIVDRNKKQLIIKRDFHGRAESIKTPNNFSIKLKMNNFEMLRSIISVDNRSTTVNYLTNTGLITTQSESNGDSISFSYEKNGRIKEIVEADNMLTNVKYSVNASGILVFMNRSSDSFTETWIINDRVTQIFKNNVLNATLEKKLFNIRLRNVSNTTNYSKTMNKQNEKNTGLFR